MQCKCSVVAFHMNYINHFAEFEHSDGVKAMMWLHTSCIYIYTFWPQSISMQCIFIQKQKLNELNTKKTCDIKFQ